MGGLKGSPYILASKLGLTRTFTLPERSMIKKKVKRADSENTWGDIFREGVHIVSFRPVG
jgi:hypothetical protein